ncbi:MAG: Uma2 family endonuclease [Chloroflexi bacterium]|nr:Uma2 family endonuclease [Chloroflexota bacterium]
MESPAAEKVGMPLADFIAASNQQVFELINGERRNKMPTVFGHSKTIRTTFRLLDTHAVAHELGEVYSETTFVLPDTYDAEWVTGSRTPDVMFITKARLIEYLAQTSDADNKPLALVPDLVIEIVSPSDAWSEVDEKIELYLADGVRMVWVLDPQRRKGFVYTPESDTPRVLKGDALLSGGDVLPGFSIPLPQVFA